MLNYVPHDVAREDRPDGTIRLRSRVPLGPVARNTGSWVDQWAAAAPDRVFVGQRSGEGWRELRYGELLGQVRAVAAALLGRGLNGETPILVISGNGIDHAVLSLAAQYVGVPVAPLAEQYALVPDAHPRLAYAAELVKPRLVFADDGDAYGPALALPGFDGVEKVVSHGGDGGTTSFADLLGGDRGADLDAATRAVGPDTLAKIIFTSGSTATPKGVLTTHRMLCVNQAQMAAVNPVFTAKPPRILDWLPWNHVFGGNHNFNIVLSNGGSLYIDDGKPTRSGFAASLRNIREHAGNLSFNVPIGYAQLVAAMRDDRALRRAFFEDLDLIFYAAASVSQDLWDALAGMAREIKGEVPLMVAAWGMSETAPAALQSHQPVGSTGNVGVPLPGVTTKLIPDEDGRCELRVRGPNAMPGYYRDPEKTREAFDPEGFLVTGDAVKFVEPADAGAGLGFDGRIAEDFKLMSGTWVRATIVRLEALKHFDDIVQDIVVTGHDRHELGLLIFPDPGFVRSEGLAQAPHDGAFVSGRLSGMVGERLAAFAARSGGSSTRIMRALVLAAPPSMSDGELTAKGSINNRRVLTLRKTFVDRLYDDADPAVTRLAEGTA